MMSNQIAICNGCKHLRYNSWQSADEIIFENFCIHSDTKKIGNTKNGEKVKIPKWCPK